MTKKSTEAHCSPLPKEGGGGRFTPHCFRDCLEEEDSKTQLDCATHLYYIHTVYSTWRIWPSLAIYEQRNAKLFFYFVSWEMWWFGTKVFTVRTTRAQYMLDLSISALYMVHCAAQFWAKLFSSIRSTVPPTWWVWYVVFVHTQHNHVNQNQHWHYFVFMQ